MQRLLPILSTLALCLLGACSEDNPARPGLPDDPGCAPGALQCPCDEGACTEGRCADGTCIPCPAGADGCPCDADERCAETLTCIDNTCAPDDCAAGSLDCPCDADERCDDGLTCLNDTCIALGDCTPGAINCMCAAGACDAPLVCLDQVCRDCAPDTVGCPCVDSACEGGLICDEGACQPANDCAAAGCAEFQQCEASADGQDARCLEACTDGRVWDPVAERCQRAVASCDPDAPGSIAATCADAQRTCVTQDGSAACGPCLAGFIEDGDRCIANPQATCAPGNESIADDCAAAHRACVDDADGARCGDCLAGFVLDPATDACTPIDDFGACDSTEDCPDGLHCTARQPGEEPRCLPAACGVGETFDLRAQACTDRCECAGPGLTGTPWPVTDWNGDCLCETTPGFFFNTSASSRTAEPCDADGDGWTRRSAFAHITAEDDAVRLNARCDLRTIDTIRLVNEYGQRLDLTVATLTNGTRDFEPMYETDESDDAAEAEERQSVPYGARRLQAAELNPLTKACVSTRDDYNDNGISDVREHQRAVPEPQRAWMATFVAASYFVELHTGRWEPPAAGTHGRYVITERSRCDARFGLGYDASEGPYGASCARRRDSGYSPAEPVGYDFQRWSCANPDGACAPLAPPVPAISVDGVPPHGLCDERGEDPEEWRGMGHASQFKCVEIVSDQEPQLEIYQRPRAALQLTAGDAGRLSLNVCALDPADAPADGNPLQPGVTCNHTVAEVAADREALIGAVGLAAVRFTPYNAPAEYAGGCIDEAAEWPQLCPGFDPAVPAATVKESNASNFGKIICGCGLNYGGPGCDLGCPDEQLHVGGTNDRPGCVNGYCVVAPDGEDGGRSGAWLCGGFVNTSYQQIDPELGGALHGEGALLLDGAALEGRFTVRGQVPVFGTDGTPLCEATNDAGDCAGMTVR